MQTLFYKITRRIIRLAYQACFFRSAILICIFLFFPQTLFSEEIPLQNEDLKNHKEFGVKKKETTSSSLDKALTQKIRSALILTPDLFDAFLRVKVIDQVAYLKGRALSQEELDLAITTISQIEGILDVRSDVEIRPLSIDDKEELEALRVQTPLPPPSYPSQPRKTRIGDSGPSIAEKTAERMRQQQKRVAEDQRIKREVLFAIQMEVDMTRLRGLHVTVSDGVVTLSGVVDDNLMRRRCGYAARRVRGVKRVSNQLRF